MNCCRYKLHNSNNIWLHKKTKKVVVIYSAYGNGVYYNLDGNEQFNRIDDFVRSYERLPLLLRLWVRVVGALNDRY